MAVRKKRLPVIADVINTWCAHNKRSQYKGVSKGTVSQGQTKRSSHRDASSVQNQCAIYHSYTSPTSDTYKTKLALDKEVGGGASPIEKPFHV